MDTKGFRNALISGLIIASLLTSAALFSLSWISLTPASSGAQIWTEDGEGNIRTDFEPDETVHIHGSGFSINAQIDINITRPDSILFQGSTFSDNNGDFVYPYLLDGITGAYTVMATDGTNTATTIFTDAKVKIKTYKDFACTILETVFYQGETVYAKATGLKSDKYYKFVWVNPSGDNVKQMVYENGATSRTDNYPLPSDASIGRWRVTIFKGTSSSGPWSHKRTAKFHVWQSITPIADSWVELTKPNTNKGGARILRVRVDWDEKKGVVRKLRRAYLKFDLSSLPPGAMITSAKLQLRKKSGNDIPSVYRTTDNWTENGITWNNQPGSGTLENDNGTVSGKWVEWGITSYAASEYAGDKVLSVVLKFKTESGLDQRADFTSRERKYNRRPWLEISYHVAAWQVVESWTGTVKAPAAAWQLIETWTGTIEVPAVWKLIETWTGTIEATAEAWRLIETWVGTVETPVVAQWQMIDSWYGSVEAPLAWQLIETWTGTVEAPALAWQLIETWMGTVSAPALLGTPALSSPADGVLTNDNTPTFDWSDVADAVEYRLQVDNDADFSSPEINVLVSVSTYTPTTALADENYSWRVQARDAANNLSPWSGVWTFVIDTAAPAAPTLVSPSDGIITNDNTPTFDWSDVADAVEYRLQVDNDPDFSSPEIQVTVSVSTYTPTAELSDDNYSWKVRARDAANNLSGWSSVWTFSVAVRAPVVAEVDLAIPLAISAFLIGAAILAAAYLLRVRPKKAARRMVLRDVSLGPRGGGRRVCVDRDC